MNNFNDKNVLEIEFHQSMLRIYKLAKEDCQYTPTRFLQMVQEYGGLKTAKRLLANQEMQSGLTTLWECGRMDLSMEALVINPKYQPLFTEAEIETARARLASYGFIENGQSAT